jgi:endonuclease YncB( thermonuclease family)
LTKEKKRGRPRINEELLDRQVTIRLTQTEYDNLVQYCFTYDMSPTQAVRFCLDVLSVTGL